MCEEPERRTVEYRNLSKKFAHVKKEYVRQYNRIYIVRLESMREILLERIKNKWGDVVIYKLHQLTEDQTDKCVVMGTLFKDQKLKPSVLKQLAEGNSLVPQPIVTHFTDESDLLFIEDELQRYQVLGALKGEHVVTGISCALLGTVSTSGKFMVQDYLFAGYRNQVERPLVEEDLLVVFISGLDFLNINKSQINLQLLVAWISGLTNEAQATKIVRVIIAGNSVKVESEKRKPTISMTSRVPESSETIDAVKLFDSWLLQLCEILEVDLMPGEHDPSNHILPQQQMHYCMFPESAVYKSLNAVPNPYCCSLAGVKIMGTSGQPVQDILRYSEITEPLEALENCLKWNHLAPTAPDTLGCYPFYESDPFIIEECPHVMFAGNQAKFDTKIADGENGQKVRLICVPQFSTTFQACVLNLKDLECTSMVFSTR